MDNMLNVITVEGVLTSEVRLTYDENKKTSVGKFYLKNTTKVGKNVYHNDFYVVVYGRKAEACEQHLYVGKRCSVTGKVSTWVKPGQNGHNQVGVTILAQDVNYEEEECNDVEEDEVE